MSAPVSRVLVWVDGTAESCRAAAWAAGLARPLGAEVALLAVGRRHPRDAALEDYARVEGVDVPVLIDLPAQADACLRDAAAAVRAAGLPEPGTETRPGPPAAAICDLAREWSADLVVVGRHRASFAERLFGAGIGEGCAFAVLSVP